MKNQVSLRHPLPIVLVLRDERLHGAPPSYQSTQTSWQKEALGGRVRQPCAPWDALGICSRSALTNAVTFLSHLGVIFPSFWCKT